MKVRYYTDPESQEPHLHRHRVSEAEVEEVLGRPMEDRVGADGSRVALGRTRGGRYLRVVYVPDPICGHGLRSRAESKKGASTPAPKEEMNKDNFPPGWDAERVRRVLEHYEGQADDEAVAEDEAAFETTTHTAMEVPVDLVPRIREMIAKRRTA